ncbi:MAG: GAF domain-containing protein [Pirellulales bacterium]
MLADICRAVEARLPGALCSVMILKDDGKTFGVGLGPSLPDAYHEYFDGHKTGEGEGSCGTAACRGRTVVSADIESDSLWRNYLQVARQYGLRACWSVPICGGEQQGESLRPRKVYGTFAVYHRRPTQPVEADLEVITRAAHMASIAMERSRYESALLAEEARFRTFVDHATEAFFLISDDDARILDVNRQACESLGYTREQLVGQTPMLFGGRASPEFFREVFPHSARRNRSVRFGSSP